MYKISIITASYNSANTIRRTIESVLMQEYANLEYIIIDGLSTDGTRAVVESFGLKVHKFVSEKDNGIYEAFNKGVKLASGEIIGFIGSDDFYPHKKVLRNVAEAFEKNDTDSLYGDKQYVNNKDEIVRYWKAGEYKRSNFKLGWMPPHLSFYLKKDCYLRYGLYNENFSLAGDYELMLRMLYINKITTQYLPSALITMQTGGVSTKNLKNRLRANREDRNGWLVNNIKPPFYTLYLKPLLKITQFFKTSR